MSQATERPEAKPVTSTPITSHGFHKHYDAAREEQSFQLKDGRMMGFAEYGSPNGTPAFFFHGCPGSRYDGTSFMDTGEKFNIRIICPDRPGHGLSTFQPDRRLIDYPDDIQQLARHLNISQYHVFGQSGGGPYVIACAYGLPSDQLLNAVVVAGMGPPEINTIKQAGLFTVVGTGLVKRAPKLCTSVLDGLVSNEARLQKGMKLLYKLLVPKSEKRGSDEFGVITKTCIIEAFAKGSAGMMQDTVIYASPWNFALEDVKKKVILIYGSQDNRCPLNFGEYYNSHLPDSELFVLDGVGHFSMAHCNKKIMKKVSGEA